ncbi:hypothetical protein PQQ51_07375, partial [Paraburkholderia xenovorans]|uniref:hypothetical protein n=1 Tax=Paraburkholderia xenovorans TaxID=36873 RepID=UPI0038B9CAE2
MNTKGSFWGSPKWNGVAAIATLIGLVIAAVALWVSVQQTTPTVSTGVVKIQRILASSALPPEYFSGADGPSATLSIGGISAAPGHLQLRFYTVQNLSGRHITASDFDAPITVRALGGRKIAKVEVTPPANRPPIIVQLNADAAVIPPMLLNVGETTLIRVLL